MKHLLRIPLLLHNIFLLLPHSISNFVFHDPEADETWTRVPNVVLTGLESPLIEKARRFLTCTATNALPRPDIWWIYHGYNVTMNSKTNHTGSDIVGYVVTSQLSLAPSRHDVGLEMRCVVVNSGGGQVAVTAKLSIIWPPEQPKITGYHPSTFLKQDEEVSLKCSIDGDVGNPPASLTWTTDGVFFTPPVIANRTNTVFRVGIDWNERRIECRAFNAATHADGIVLVAPITFKVAFGPKMAPVVVGVTSVDSGDALKLECLLRDVVNPAPEFRWIKADKPLVEKAVPASSTTPGDFPHGFLASHELSLNPVAADHGAVIKCEAVNPVTKLTASSVGVLLDVRHQPGSPSIEFSEWVVEGAEAIIRCRSMAPGNPKGPLTLMFDGVKLARKNDLVEAKLKAKRDLSGKKVECVADNGVGSLQVSSAAFRVAYGPTEVRIGIERLNHAGLTGAKSIRVKCAADDFEPEIAEFRWEVGSSMQISKMPGVVEYKPSGFRLRQSADLLIESQEIIPSIKCVLVNKVTNASAESDRIDPTIFHLPGNATLDGGLDALKVGVATRLGCSLPDDLFKRLIPPNLIIRVGERILLGPEPYPGEGAVVRVYFVPTPSDDGKKASCRFEHPLFPEPLVHERVLRIVDKSPTTMWEFQVEHLVVVVPIVVAIFFCRSINRRRRKGRKHEA